jgi:hypothetical protein
MNDYKHYLYNLQNLSSFMSVFDNIKKGALHRQVGVPETETIPKSSMKALCHGSIGDEILINGHEVTVTPKIKKRACFGLNFGYRK